MIDAHKGVVEGKITPESYQEMLNSGGDFSKLKQVGEKPSYEMKTVYGLGGQTKEVSIVKGTEYTPPKGWTLKPPREPLAGERQTPTQRWNVVSKIEDDARAYANVTVPKAANKISIGEDGKIVIGGQIADADVKKWVNAFQNHYSRKVDEAKGMGALPENYKVKPIIEEKPEINNDPLRLRGR